MSLATWSQHGYVIQSDASQFGVEATLLERINVAERVIAYASMKLLPRKKLYSIIERDLLAVTFSLQKFEQYVYGKEIRLETDHKPLLYLKSLADKSSGVARWALLLQCSDLTFIARIYWVSWMCVRYIVKTLKYRQSVIFIYIFIYFRKPHKTI